MLNKISLAISCSYCAQVLNLADLVEIESIGELISTNRDPQKNLESLEILMEDFTSYAKDEGWSITNEGEVICDECLAEQSERESSPQLAQAEDPTAFGAKDTSAKDFYESSSEIDMYYMYTDDEAWQEKDEKGITKNKSSDLANTISEAQTILQQLGSETSLIVHLAPLGLITVISMLGSKYKVNINTSAELSQYHTSIKLLLKCIKAFQQSVVKAAVKIYAIMAIGKVYVFKVLIDERTMGGTECEEIIGKLDNNILQLPILKTVNCDILKGDNRPIREILEITERVLIHTRDYVTILNPLEKPQTTIPTEVKLIDAKPVIELDKASKLKIRTLAYSHIDINMVDGARRSLATRGILCNGESLTRSIVTRIYCEQKAKFSTEAGVSNKDALREIYKQIEERVTDLLTRKDAYISI